VCDEDVADTPRGSILRQTRMTTLQGRQVTLPMYPHMPPYFDRPLRLDVRWIPNPPLDDIPADSLSGPPLSERYAARQYGDLVSDERANRAVLDWLRRFKGGKLGRAGDRPPVLLLAGPPGCGKSTLVRVVAAVSGFHVVELNASEDVSTERNQLLLNSGRFSTSSTTRGSRMR